MPPQEQTGASQQDNGGGGGLGVGDEDEGAEGTFIILQRYDRHFSLEFERVASVS
jgi:hypothetical protein